MLADISESIDIDASPERVWEVVTSPELVAEWLGCLGFTGEIGSTFYMQPDPAKRAAGDTSGATHCELEALDPPRSMLFSWFVPGTPKTHVRIELGESGGARTRVRLIHSGWDQFDEAEMKGLRDMLAGGWKSFVLPGLKSVAERTAG
jgi:uncharacterized protein YndB with AHSA1/START domain